MQRAGGAYIEIRADSKKLPGDLNKAHSKVASTAKKMESSITKAFKRMAFVATAAFAVVAYKTASLVKETALLAARFETLEIVMKQVGKNAGYSAEQMDEFDKNLRATGISMIESRNSLARMAQAQLDLTQATKLGRIAQDAAVVGNINSSEAFQRMIYGIQSGQTEVLKTIGINVNFQNSYMAVAKATNRAVTSFSESEKAIIRQNAVIEYGSRLAGTYEAAMTTAGKKLSSFARYVEDFKVKMGLAFGPATVLLVDAATKAMKQMQEEISKPEAQQALRNISSELSTIIVQLGKELPSKIATITEKLEGLWKIATYDPAIIEWGIVGLLIGGKKGAVLMGSMAHMITWADNLGKALGLVSAGILDISQVATANFKELQELINRFDFPDPLKDLQLHAKELREEIEHLEKVTVGRARFFKGDKEDLIRARIELTEIQSKIAKIKEKTFIEGLITFKMPTPPKIPEMPIPPKIPEMPTFFKPPTAASFEEQLIFTIKMAETEQERLNEKYELEKEYNKKIHDELLSDTEFRLQELDRQFLDMTGHIEDEAELDKWYIKQYKEIMGIKKEIHKSWTDGAKAGLDDYAKSAMDVVGNVQNAFESGFQSMEDALVDFCMTGKLDFADFANSIIRDMLRIYIQSQITGVLASAISSYFGGTSIVQGTGINTAAQQGIPNVITTWGQGGTFPAGISAHSNSIVDSPTLFSFAQGAGVYGEAGPEAIMPLTRLPGGDLGVKAESGGESKRPMEIHIHEAPGTQTRTEQSEDGTRLDVIIEQVEQTMQGRMGRGTGLAPFMDSRYARAY